MILKQYVPLIVQTKPIYFFVFTSGDQCFENIGFAFVFQHFEAIEVIDDRIVGVDEDAALVPVANFAAETGGWLFSWNEIVEAGEGAIAHNAQLNCQHFVQ